MSSLKNIVAGMDPEDALKDIAQVLKGLFRDLGKDAASGFLMDMIEQSGGDKLTSMVHL